MSTSEHLRETHTELGGGRGIFTEGAKVLEGNVAQQVQELVSTLTTLYPNIQFIWRIGIYISFKIYGFHEKNFIFLCTRF